MTDTADRELWAEYAETCLLEKLVKEDERTLSPAQIKALANGK